PRTLVTVAALPAAATMVSVGLCIDAAAGALQAIFRAGDFALSGDAARDPAVGFTSRTAAAAMPYVGLRVDAAAIALFEAVSTQEVTLAGNAAGKRVFWRHARRVASAAVRWVTNEVYAGARAFLRARRAVQRALTVGADLTAGAFDTASSAVAGAR